MIEKNIKNYSYPNNRNIIISFVYLFLLLPVLSAGQWIFQLLFGSIGNLIYGLELILLFAISFYLFSKKLKHTYMVLLFVTVIFSFFYNDKVQFDFLLYNFRFLAILGFFLIPGIKNFLKNSKIIFISIPVIVLAAYLETYFINYFDIPKRVFNFTPAIYLLAVIIFLNFRIIYFILGILLCYFEFSRFGLMIFIIVAMLSLSKTF